MAAGVEHRTGKKVQKKNEKIQIENYHGVHFFWISVPCLGKRNITRMIDMLVYTLRAINPIYTKKIPRPDVIIGSQVHPFAVWAASVLSKRFKVPFIFEVRDLWPQTLIDMGYLKEHSVKTKLMKCLEKYLYKRAEKIISLLPNAFEYIVRTSGVRAEKISYIPNGVDLDEFPFEKYPKKDNEFQLMYFGAHGRANALDTLIDAIAFLNKRIINRFKLRFIGDGPLKPELVKKVKKMGLHNVYFEDAVPKSKIPMIAAQANALVIIVHSLDCLARFGISPNKLFDYMAAGRPILIASKAANNPVKEAGCGMSVASDNAELIAEKIYKLANTPRSKLEKMGQKGRNYLEQHHDYKKLATTLSDLLNSTV
jgi:glycosyltransferase involved in cell wall biosynthesis